MEGLSAPTLLHRHLLQRSVYVMTTEAHTNSAQRLTMSMRKTHSRRITVLDNYSTKAHVREEEKKLPTMPHLHTGAAERAHDAPHRTFGRRLRVKRKEEEMPLLMSRVLDIASPSSRRRLLISRCRLVSAALECVRCLATSVYSLFLRTSMRDLTLVIPCRRNRVRKPQSQSTLRLPGHDEGYMCGWTVDTLQVSCMRDVSNAPACCPRTADQH